MKKLLTILLALCVASAIFAGGGRQSGGGTASSGAITVGIINNPPSESGYRTANDKDFKSVFTAANGYDASFAYSINLEEQLVFFNQFVTNGVDYILLSAASTDGWDDALRAAQRAGVKVFLFDRMVSAPESLYEAAVVSDMAEEGKTAVNWLKDQKLSGYNVIHLQGVMGSDAQIGRTAALDAEFNAGTMKKVIQQTGNWSADEAKAIVQSVINAGTPFNVIYAENDDMARGAVDALDAAGITHGVDKEVIIMGFDCNKWALRELLAKNWNYDGQCSPFQASVVDRMIKDLGNGKAPAQKKIISEEKGFDARTITQADVDQYGLGE
ncbi:MAG: substrate-binding domain-containing protein [Treponema sp.]|jgi:simple sugar transport system substrate-binding protein|nr:substrate-binding domain-containing protein [Treponema sp.]